MGQTNLKRGVEDTSIRSTDLGTTKDVAIGVIVGILADALWFLISSAFSYFNVSSPFSLLTMELPLWLVICAVLIVIPTAIMFVRARQKRGMIVELIRKRPTNIIQKLASNHFGVKWNVLYGRFSLHSDPYAFCQVNPLCPDCDCEMEAEKKGLIKKYYWKCDRCGKSYECPAKSPYEASKIVERLLESEIRSGRLKLDAD